MDQFTTFYLILKRILTYLNKLILCVGSISFFYGASHLYSANLMNINVFLQFCCCTSALDVIVKSLLR